MDRGVWQATGHGVTRVGHDLVTRVGHALATKEQEIEGLDVLISLTVLTVFLYIYKDR